MQTTDIITNKSIGMDKERTGMLLLSKEDIKSVITMKDMIEADKQAFKMVVDGTVDTPLRTVINGKYDGAFLFMPAYAPELDAAAMKVINIFPHNIDNNLMTSPAQTMLIDGKTGYVIAMLDGTYVTQLRTGASSGAAFDLLGKKECKKGAMIGTGGQAAAQLEAMLAASNIGVVICIQLNCTYDGLRFIPLFPAMETETVLAWKKDQTYSAATAAFIDHAKKYLKGISNNTI